MLKNITAKTYFLFTYILVGSVQIYAAFNHQLFGDEAFYWLESQWLSWSYSEVPGWTPWTLAFIDWLLPHHQFSVRIPNLMAALSIPWLGIFISRALSNEKNHSWLIGALLMALPILGVAGTLAVPDVWLVFFSLLAVWVLLQAIGKNHTYLFIILGLVLALGINVHLRFWLVILVTSGAVFWRFRSHHVVLKLLKFTLPMMLLGFIPVLIFNLQHDFPLLSFQLKDRHPWEFQPSHLSFFLTQVVITTPWVFYLCLTNLKSGVMINAGSSTQQLLIKTIVWAATVHWLVYAILGFFSDTLRLNIHWTLVSYVLLLVTTNQSNTSARLLRWAVVTGVTANLWLLFTLSHWLQEQTPQSQLSDRITHNATGWHQLAQHTDALLIKENQQSLITDHFMSLAQLKFYSQQINHIKALPHPLNTKHGRDKQLQIMDLIQAESDVPQLLVVEHSALKLTEVIGFYQSTCKKLHGIQLIDSLDINHGTKRYHYFNTASRNGACDIPPIVYYQFSNQLLSGWVLHDKTQPLAISLFDATHQTKLDTKLKLSTQPLGTNPLFQSLNPDQYQLLEFSLDEQITQDKDTLQLQLDYANHRLYSQRLMLNP
jgi:hypothetical protein